MPPVKDTVVPAWRLPQRPTMPLVALLVTEMEPVEAKLPIFKVFVLESATIVTEPKQEW